MSIYHTLYHIVVLNHCADVTCLNILMKFHLYSLSRVKTHTFIYSDTYCFSAYTHTPVHSYVIITLAQQRPISIISKGRGLLSKYLSRATKKTAPTTFLIVNLNHFYQILTSGSMVSILKSAHPPPSINLIGGWDVRFIPYSGSSIIGEYGCCRQMAANF